MAITLFQIKRWVKMLTGRSIEHVNQNIGKCFTADGVSGYYNDLTEKVTRCPELLSSNELPLLCLSNGEKVHFPVAIFQYGLGAYDLYLSTGNDEYLHKFIQCADWALNHIDEKGRWNNFFFYNAEAPYGAMAQGEGASLLIRAYRHTGDTKYLSKAREAIDFMLTPLRDGGTTKYGDGNAILMEYTFLNMVLNGAIFAWWGLYDFVTVTGDTGRYKQLLSQTLKSIIKTLPDFKSRVWSMYSLDGQIASPFYHNLHIAQMEAMYQLTGKDIFNEYARRWRKQQKNIFCLSLAFIMKALQKIRE